MKKSTLARHMLVLAFGLCAGGCQNNRNDRDLVFVTPVEAQEAVLGQKKLLGLGGAESGVYVDSRRAEDFRAGHIPGAISLPYENVSTDHSVLKNHDVLVVYGNDYNDSRSDGMSKRLMELGYSDVRTLIGGLRAWKTEGNPMEAGDAAKPATAQ